MLSHGGGEYFIKDMCYTLVILLPIMDGSIKVVCVTWCNDGIAWLALYDAVVSMKT